MKKYIRTKDGKIYDSSLLEWDDYNEFWVYKDEKNGDTIGIPYGLIEREADTIEELCDCFVVKRPQPKGNDYYILHRIAYVKEHCLNGNEVVYGAIWTDKGLTYVAKMNSKGEMELL